MGSAPALNDSSVACFARGTEGDLTQCAVDGVFAAGPSPAVIGLLLAGVLLTSLYIAGDGTIVVPAVVTLLLGGTLLALLPAQFVTLAWTVTVIGAAAAGFGAYIRFVGRGGF